MGALQGQVGSNAGGRRREGVRGGAGRSCSGRRLLEFMQKREEKHFISGRVLLQTDQDFRKTTEPAWGSRPEGRNRGEGVRAELQSKDTLSSTVPPPPVGNITPTTGGARLLSFQSASPFIPSPPTVSSGPHDLTSASPVHCPALLRP